MAGTRTRIHALALAGLRRDPRTSEGASAGAPAAPCAATAEVAAAAVAAAALGT